MKTDNNLHLYLKSIHFDIIIHQNIHPCYLCSICQMELFLGLYLEKQINEINE